MPEYFNGISKFLIIAGLILIAGGILWPLFQKLGFGHLPGDIIVNRKNFHFYFPVSTSILLSILLSIILTILLWLFQKLR